MRYLIAFFLPPLAILLCGRPFLALLNVLLCLFLYIPGQIHAMLVVHEHLADKRAARITRELRGVQPA